MFEFNISYMFSPYFYYFYKNLIQYFYLLGTKLGTNNTLWKIKLKYI